MNVRTVIVDSDSKMLQMHQEILEEVTGYAAAYVSDSAALVLDGMTEAGPYLLLLDLKLPDADGIGFIRRIRQLDLPVDVIVVTSLCDTGTVETAFRLGVFDYIIKPFRPSRLKRAVESYLAVRTALPHTSEVDQAWIDSYVNRSPSMVSAEKLPKGYHRLTMAQVVSFLTERCGSVSAEEVAAGIGFSRATARRYLEFLVRAGLARSELQYGSVGRPTTKYLLTCHKE